MDRAAKLAAEARKCVQFEASVAEERRELSRPATRLILFRKGLLLGYSSELEISAAIDEALTAAGATP